MGGFDGFDQSGVSGLICPGFRIIRPRTTCSVITSVSPSSSSTWLSFEASQAQSGGWVGGRAGGWVGGCVFVSWCVSVSLICVFVCLSASLCLFFCVSLCGSKLCVCVSVCLRESLCVSVRLCASLCVFVSAFLCVSVWLYAKLCSQAACIQNHWSFQALFVFRGHGQSPPEF